MDFYNSDWQLISIETAVWSLLNCVCVPKKSIKKKKKKRKKEEEEEKKKKNTEYEV